MLALFACLVATQVPIEQPPRLRTILDNGAAILVEKVPGAKTLSLDFFASSRGAEESAATNGVRHLLEHLIARGPKGDIDVRLETAGGFLQAETLRDAMEFKITLPAGQLPLGMRIVAELMQMPVVTPESIQHEALIIEQEMALRENSSKLAAAAWMTSFGDKGLDVVGTLDVIRNTTPAMLEKVHREQFSGPNIAITAVGDLDLDDATKACSAVLSKSTKTVVKPIDRGVGVGGTVNSSATGQAIALPVTGWRYPETAARVAAAFALASEVDNGFVIYTPSAGAGLVIVGRSTSNTGLENIVAKANANDLFVRGRSLAKSWIQNMLQSPSGIAEARGLLLVQEFDLKPETMIENLDTMSVNRFTEALAAFRSPEAVTVVGK
jgi:predicted Zn-dependent peptidase